MKRVLSILCASVAFSLCADCTVSDDRPADARWESSWYPIGNGELGAMLDGGTAELTVQFNLDSFWTGGATDDFGDYQSLGALKIALPRPGLVSGYRRTLDFANAEYRDSFTVSECGDNCKPVRVTRRAFASHPDGLIAIRIETDIALERPIVETLRGAHGEAVRDRGFGGALPNGLGYRVRVDRLDETNAVTYILRAATTYWGALPDWKPVERRFSDLRARHLADYHRLWDRMSLEIDGEGASAARLFGFGRYLLISSSRPGTLPANLQGVWNDSNRPTWHSDYHTNINLQMNYWGADAANLSDCFEPLADWMVRTRTATEAMTRAEFPESRGFAYRTSANPFGGGTFVWNFAGAPWLGAMLYDHYLHTGDREWLRATAYPLMKGAAEFILGRLKERPDGTVVVADGWSPEHGPREDGVTHDHQVVRELFRSVLGAARELGVDDAFTRIVARQEGRLLREKVGRWGQLQEWEADRDVKGDMHRHTSHLFGVYPGTTVTRTETPELFAAARVSLEGRALTGDAWRSWTWPWRAALWARFGDGEKAGEMIESLLRCNTFPNLLTAHPPFQIDGNLGVLGAMAEMLVQSHERTPGGKVVLRLLPALPKSWAAGGRVVGLRARGGYTVDFSWKDGRIVSSRVRGPEDGYRLVITERKECEKR